jgi:formate hydrogenlyase subunit 3/multisubunit Na+/H+ antiporter MnhD subunit
VHLRLDALSSFFLVILGGAGAGISIYAAGYVRRGKGTAPGLQCLQYQVFLAGMAFVLLADDAYSFMLAWETVALACFFLVTSDHRLPGIREAGYLYLLVVHVGAIGILLCFGVLDAGSGEYTFAHMRESTYGKAWASAAFLLALFGFGAAAGIMPMHVWLPAAHAGAPSPVAAMMSAVMLKLAVYGLLRVIFDLLHLQLAWWGVILVAAGIATAVYGVAFSAVQSDMKRLLAYSSVENMGTIATGLGLAILFQAHGKSAVAVLVVTATLYHCLNHAFFKSLLFLCTGSVLHATHERSLGKLGGLIHRMPWVAWLALLGVLACAGLPPLNGFVSSWLLLQSFLLTPALPQGYLNMLLPVGGAAVALAAALAGYVMVKFYGVIFLGQPREDTLREARDASPLERVGLTWLGGCCVVLAILPVAVISRFDPVTQLLVGGGLAEFLRAHGWFMLAPITPERASYNPAVFLAVIGVMVALTFLVVRAASRCETRRTAPWNGGLTALTPRMQDTAEGFGQPLLQVFQPLFRIRQETIPAADGTARTRVKVQDHLWDLLFLPTARIVEFVSRLVGHLQRGRISVYLLYSFVTLLALMLLIHR